MVTYGFTSRCMGRDLPIRNGAWDNAKSVACASAGMRRSKSNLDLLADASMQSAGFALTVAGFLLGHSHKGRAFYASAHGSFATILYLPIVAQFVLGVYLKMHIHEQSIRPWAVRAHGVLGKSYPILGWVQMLLGAATFRSFCRGGHLGQCLAHYIMVSIAPSR